MKHLLTVLTVAAFSSAAFAQDPCFPGFKGEIKTAVNLKKDWNNKNFSKIVPDHLDFLKHGFADQKIQYAGPMIDTNPPAAALIILNTADRDEAKAFASTDPMVVHHVFKPVYTTWLQCVPE